MWAWAPTSRLEATACWPGGREEAVKAAASVSNSFLIHFPSEVVLREPISEKAANVGPVNSTSKGCNGGREREQKMD